MVQPGDIGFARTTGIMGRLIRLGEWLKFRKSTFNHQFILDREVDGVWYVIQATLRGITDSATLDSVARSGTYVTMPPPDEVDRARVLQFARAQVGLEYGYWTILAISLDILTWQWVPSLRGARKQSWICSALTCEALRFGGWLHNWLDVYDVMPQQAYDLLAQDTQ